jgi:hypothetical protein
MGMTVAPLYGWAGRTNPNATVPAAKLLAFVSALEGFRAANPDLAATVSSYSFDIEPASQAQYQSYAGLLAQLKANRDSSWVSSAGQPPARCSIAGSWGYAAVNVSCSADLLAITPQITMQECALRNVDTYILMNYRNNADGCYCHPNGEKNPSAYECKLGSSIPGKCPNAAAGVASGGGRDGMIGKALPVAVAIKALLEQQHHPQEPPQPRVNNVFAGSNDGLVARGAVESTVSNGRIGDDASSSSATNTGNIGSGSSGPAKLALGVETSCFASSDWSDHKYEYKLSFCKTSTAYLTKQQEDTMAWFVQNGTFSHVFDASHPWVVEDYKALQALERG